jgi:hypothetical protein
MNKTQKGFGAVAALLIVVILVSVIGGGGVYVWYKNESKTDTNLSTANQTVSTPVITKSTSNKSPAYLNVKEMGIRIKLSSKIDDAYYKYNSKGDDATFYLKSMDSLYNVAGVICKDNALALTSKMTEKDYKDFISQSGYEDTAKKIDGNYFYNKFPDGGPCRDNSKGEPIEGALDKVDELEVAVDSLEEIPQ